MTHPRATTRTPHPAAGTRALAAADRIDARYGLTALEDTLDRHSRTLDATIEVLEADIDALRVNPSLTATLTTLGHVAGAAALIVNGPRRSARARSRLARQWLAVALHEGHSAEAITILAARSRQRQQARTAVATSSHTRGAGTSPVAAAAAY